jgi:hypothetical protein
VKYLQLSWRWLLKLHPCDLAPWIPSEIWRLFRAICFLDILFWRWRLQIRPDRYYIFVRLCCKICVENANRRHFNKIISSSLRK